MNIDHLLTPKRIPSDGTFAQRTDGISVALSVLELTQLISNTLESAFPATISVSGEISNLSVASSGHRYFSLKDREALIACSFFKNAATKIPATQLNALKNGDQIIVKGKLAVYKPRGNYQLIVSDVQPAGAGQLAQAFLQLKQKLEQAGYTADEHKQAISSFPKSIAVISSPTGAAIQDVLVTLARRAPFIPVQVYPALVQGERAVDELIVAIDKANHNPAVEVILLVRGGGSLEDLQAFNTERLAMAVFNSTKPIVCGVGHETDFSICDFVADYRAATPTAAAEKVSPDKAALQRVLQLKNTRLSHLLRGLYQNQQRLFLARDRRLQLQNPERILQDKQQRLDEQFNRLQFMLQQCWRRAQAAQTARHQRLKNHRLPDKFRVRQERIQWLQQRLHRALQQHWQGKKQEFEQQLLRLTLLNPEQVLARGYAIVQDLAGDVITDRKTLQAQNQIRIRLKDASDTVLTIAHPNPQNNLI